jgi:hypothetical protein
VLAFSGSALSAATATRSGRPHGRRFDEIFLTKNQWRMPVSNYGMFGYDAGRGSAGGEWPRGSGDMYIFGAGFWFGRRANNNADTNVTVGYNPSSGKSEFTPGAWDNAPGGYSGRDFERVYAYPEDWPPNPTDFPTDMQDSVLTPLRIAVPGGDTIHGYFYPIPRKALSTGDLWSVFNDRDPANMEPKGVPIGIEVYQSTYVWNLPSNRDIVFFTYVVKNVSADSIKDAYMGIACDGDIGGANNDYAGLFLHRYVHSPSLQDSLWVDNVGMEWSGPETGWPTYPGVLAIDFFQSPFLRQPDGHIRGWPDTTTVYPNGLDDNHNGLIDEPAEGEQVGMTAYKIFTLQAGDPAGDGKQYEALQGKEWWVTPPLYAPYDSLDNTPNDKRFLQSTGPFVLAPDSMVTVTVGVMAAPMSHLPSDRDTSFWRLAITDNSAQQVYNNNWLAPQPPPSPGFALIPGDGKVTIVWDNLPENFSDPYYPLARSSDTLFREKDFEGYKIYRSQTGQTGEWKLLTQCDKKDGIIWQDTTTVESLRTKATDSGLFYSYTDSSSIRFGFPYYYAVTSFGYNTLGVGSDTTPLSLESGMLQEAITTRTSPSNYVAPQAGVSQSFGNPDIKAWIQPTVVAPQAIKRETLEIHFLPIAYGGWHTPKYSFCILHGNGDTAVSIQSFTLDLDSRTDTVRFNGGIFDSVVTRISYDTVKKESLFTKDWLPSLQVSVKVKMDSIPEQTFDSIHVVSGHYPSHKFLFPSYTAGGADNFIWPYRGCQYQVVWQAGDSGGLTAGVSDLATGELISFQVESLVPSHPERAAGWCFLDSIGGHLWVASETASVGVTWYMMINGDMFALNSVRDTSGVIHATVLRDTMPAVGDTWIVYPLLRYSPAPANAVYRIATDPLEFLVTHETLDVKVVPNPYLVTNEWERHPDFRKLKFINLPNDCTIRIYTMAGDLIKTLQHHETNVISGSVLNQQGGDEDWDLLSEAGQRPAPGIYIFHIESAVGEQIGKFAVVY